MTPETLDFVRISEALEQNNILGGILAKKIKEEQMKAKELIELLSKNPDLELGGVQIMMNLVNKPEAEKKDIMLDFVQVFGRFNKGRLGENEIYLKHESPGLDVKLWEYDRCKIVGHIVKKRLVSKPAVPVEMVQIEEEYTVPVSDCQLENGEVKTEEVVFASV